MVARDGSRLRSAPLQALHLLPRVRQTVIQERPRDRLGFADYLRGFETEQRCRPQEDRKEYVLDRDYGVYIFQYTGR